MTPRTVARQFSRQEYWGGVPCPPSRIFPTQGSDVGLLHCSPSLSAKVNLQKACPLQRNGVSSIKKAHDRAFISVWVSGPDSRPETEFSRMRECLAATLHVLQLQRAGQRSQKAVFQYVLIACYSPREAEETGPDLGQQVRLVLVFCCFVLFLISAEQPTGAKKPRPCVWVCDWETDRAQWTVRLRSPVDPVFTSHWRFHSASLLHSSVSLNVKYMKLKSKDINILVDDSFLSLYLSPGKH